MSGTGIAPSLALCLAIEQRTGEAFRAEDGGPFIEWQVAGDQGGAAFITLAEHFEEQLRANRRERYVTQLIDNSISQAGSISLLRKSGW